MRRTISYLFIALVFTAAAGCAGKKGASQAGSGSSSGSQTSESEAGNSGTGSGSGSSSSGTPGSELADATVHFGFNEYTVQTEDRDKLQKAAEFLKKSGSKATIEGHCDERGSNEYNLALGERRAQSVKSYLQKLGVSGAKLSAISYGEERPADSGHSEDAWAKNRRGVIVVTK